jgi:hypothetical protein
MTKTIEKVAQVLVPVLKNASNTICEVANKLEVSDGSVHSILKENLNTCWITAKFTPCLLRKAQREDHVNTCQDLPHPPLLTTFIAALLLSFPKTDDDFKGKEI